MTLDPTYVEILNGASDRLVHLGDNAETLLSVADGLNGVQNALESAQSALEDTINSLGGVVGRLEDLRDQGWGKGGG